MSRNGGRVTILVAENDPGISDLLRAIMQREGWQTLAASDGEQAVAMALKNDADLMILDYALPQLSTIEVCRRVSAMLSMPVIMIGERDYARDKILSIRAGAKSYVGKPFQVSELLAEIKAALGISLR